VEKILKHQCGGGARRKTPGEAFHSERKEKESIIRRSGWQLQDTYKGISTEKKRKNVVPLPGCISKERAGDSGNLTSIGIWEWMHRGF